MENIKINYKQNWDSEGYHTTQNVKLSKDLFNRFNIFLENYRKPFENKHYITSEEIKLLAYAKNINNLNRCIHLTQLKLLYQFLKENNINCDRLKIDRNTMLIII